MLKSIYPSRKNQHEFEDTNIVKKVESIFYFIFFSNNLTK